jgi:voltage-gated potassium channel
MNDAPPPYVPQVPASYGRPDGGWRRRLYDIIFEADTPAGLHFDVALVVAILASILVVVLDSVPQISADHDTLMYGLEWSFTVLFTVEYVMRLLCVRHPLGYATSLYGIIDLRSIQ